MQTCSQTFPLIWNLQEIHFKYFLKIISGRERLGSKEWQSACLQTVPMQGTWFALPFSLDLLTLCQIIGVGWCPSSISEQGFKWLFVHTPWMSGGWPRCESGNCGAVADRQGTLSWLKVAVWERQEGSKDSTGVAAALFSPSFTCEPADFCWHVSPEVNVIVSRADIFLNQGQYLHSAFIHKMGNMKICTFFVELADVWHKYPSKQIFIAKTHTHTVQLKRIVKIHQYGLFLSWSCTPWTVF